jgi:hypothetical protein
VNCAVCDQLEAELTRLERVYADKTEILRSNIQSANHGFQAEESAAKLNMDFARLALDRHKRSEHKAD